MFFEAFRFLGLGAESSQLGSWKIGPLAKTSNSYQSSWAVALVSSGDRRRSSSELAAAAVFVVAP